MINHKNEQINELLRSELAVLLESDVHVDGALITISYVDCSPDLKSAKIAVSVLPEKLFGSALSELKKHSSSFSSTLRKKTRLRQIPRLHWEADLTEAKAAEIDRLLDSIKKAEQ
ncbi:ribosome-binding factor A [Candidatus Falkowbacteria bacterium]|nr:ribosome-binding factor A [Candidatus Falkowbacteria bacterium]